MQKLIPRRYIKKAVWAILSVLTVSMSVPAISAASAKTYATNAKSYQISTAELHQVLAPIALYPDTLLSHILIAATYPLDIVQAHRWRSDNDSLNGSDAVDAAELEGWHPSVVALVAFPDLLERLSDDLEGTRQLGEAFLADEERVLDQVQVLRDKAYVAGNLQKMEHVTVVKEEKIIYIEPAATEVVYVPYYDTRVVFGPWWWPKHPPRYWHLGHSHRVNRWGFFWGTGVNIHMDFVFAAPHWRERRVVVYPNYRDRSVRFKRARDVAQWRDARHWRKVRRHVRRVNNQLPSHVSTRPAKHVRLPERQQTREDVEFFRGKPAYRKTDKNDHERYRRALKERRADKDHNRHSGQKRPFHGGDRGKDRPGRTDRSPESRTDGQKIIQRDRKEDRQTPNRSRSGVTEQRNDKSPPSHIPSALERERTRTRSAGDSNARSTRREEHRRARATAPKRESGNRVRMRTGSETSPRAQRRERSIRAHDRQVK